MAQNDPVGSGRAISFDGVNDYLDFGNIYDDLELPFTISAWVYIDNTADLPGPVFTTQDNDPNIYNGFWFFVSTNSIIFEFGDGLGSDNPAFRKGKIAPVSNMQNRWNHICGVMRSATSIDIYVNGINIGGSPSGGSNFPMSSNFPGDVTKVGYHFSNATEYHFKGLMDEVRLFNRALTETEIRQQMCKKLTGNETGLIGYWNFDETTGNTLIDKSPNGFDGQLINNPTRVYSGAPIGDESLFSYQSNWPGIELTMSENGEEIEVSNVVGNPDGVHTYLVRNLPSQTQGLELTSVNAPYFGVFVAATDVGNSFDLLYRSVDGEFCELFKRSNNSVSTWISESTPFIGAIDRTEIIKIPDAGVLEIDLGEDEVICPFVPKVLNPLSNPAGFEFTWQDGSKQSTFQANDHGTYWVTVTGDCSIARDTINFTKPELGDFIIPNVFTPNDDGFNQYFVIDNDLLGSRLKVFNRWGRLVYESINYQNNWNGGDLPPGVYYYWISGDCFDQQKGWVSIIR